MIICVYIFTNFKEKHPIYSIENVKNKVLNEDNVTATWIFGCDTPKDIHLTAGKYEMFERNAYGSTISSSFILLMPLKI